MLSVQHDPSNRSRDTLMERSIMATLAVDAGNDGPPSLRATHVSVTGSDFPPGTNVNIKVSGERGPFGAPLTSEPTAVLTGARASRPKARLQRRCNGGRTRQRRHSAHREHGGILPTGTEALEARERPLNSLGRQAQGFAGFVKCRSITSSNRGTRAGSSR